MFATLVLNACDVLTLPVLQFFDDTHLNWFLEMLHFFSSIGGVVFFSIGVVAPFRAMLYFPLIGNVAFPCIFSMDWRRDWTRCTFSIDWRRCIFVSIECTFLIVFTLAQICD